MTRVALDDTVTCLSSQRVWFEDRRRDRGAGLCGLGGQRRRKPHASRLSLPRRP
jgi:hypothetical protein